MKRFMWHCACKHVQKRRLMNEKRMRRTKKNMTKKWRLTYCLHKLRCTFRFALFFSYKGGQKYLRMIDSIPIYIGTLNFSITLINLSCSNLKPRPLKQWTMWSILRNKNCYIKSCPTLTLYICTFHYQLWLSEVK